MRMAVLALTAAIVARFIFTPVYYLTTTEDDGSAMPAVRVLVGDLDRCEAARSAASAPHAVCEPVLGVWHLLGAATEAADAFEMRVKSLWQPLQAVQDTVDIDIDDGTPSL